MDSIGIDPGALKRSSPLLKQVAPTVRAHSERDLSDRADLEGNEIADPAGGALVISDDEFERTILRIERLAVHGVRNENLAGMDGGIDFSGGEDGNIAVDGGGDYVAGEIHAVQFPANRAVQFCEQCDERYAGVSLVGFRVHIVNCNLDMWQGFKIGDRERDVPVLGRTRDLQNIIALWPRGTNLYSAEIGYLQDHSDRFIWY